METVRYIIEYDGPITINNEFTAHGPLAIEWFASADLVVEAHEKITVSTENAVQLRPGVYLVRLLKAPPREGDLRLVKTHKIHNHIVKVAKGEKNTYLLVKDFAILLDSEEQVQISDNPRIAFLQHVQRGDYDIARDMLLFEISGEHLRAYFGEFEIIENNYQENRDIISILPKNSRVVKDIQFFMDGNKISNIS